MNNIMTGVIDAMAARIAAPETAFYTHFLDDFRVHDVREITLWGSPKAQWIWLVYESGTHLARLGVDAKQVELAHAFLDVNEYRLRADPPTARLYHVRGDGRIEEITAKRARAMVDQPSRYVRRGCHILRRTGGEHLEMVASARITWDRGMARTPEGTVHFDTPELSRANLAQRLEDVCALRLLAMTMIVEEQGTLFASPKRIVIDGQDIGDAVAELRARYAKCRTPCDRGQRSPQQLLPA